MSILSNHAPEVLDELNGHDGAGRLPRPRKPRKPRPKPARRIGLTLGLNAAGKNAVATITVGKESASYFIDRIPADWGTAYELTKFGTDSACVYHVNLSPDGDTCDCPGFLAHGHKTQCKHVAGLLALKAHGKL